MTLDISACLPVGLGEAHGIPLTAVPPQVQQDQQVQCEYHHQWNL